MTRINALHLMNNFEDSSICRIVLRLVEKMDLKDICWHIAGINDDGSTRELFDKLGVQTVAFNKIGQGNKEKVISQLQQYIHENDIQVIHTHTPRTIFTASLGLIGNKRVKHLATKHLLNQPNDRKWGMIFSLMDRVSLYLPDRLVPVSSTMYDQIIAQPGIQTERVITIRNAIPNEQFYAPDLRLACRNELGIPADALVLGYTGRLKKVKRIDLLLDAFAQIKIVHPNTYLIIAGDGELRAQLETYADTLGISSNISWAGFRKDIPRILAAMDLYIQTSVNEGLSLSLLEAMAAGIPVIATDVGGNAEIIKTGTTGILVGEDVVNEVTKAVFLLVERPELCDQLRKSGLELIRNEFSMGSMVAGYQKLYLSIIEENGFRH